MVALKQSRTQHIQRIEAGFGDRHTGFRHGVLQPVKPGGGCVRAVFLQQPVAFAHRLVKSRQGFAVKRDQPDSKPVQKPAPPGRAVHKQPIHRRCQPQLGAIAHQRLKSFRRLPVQAQTPALFAGV